MNAVESRPIEIRLLGPVEVLIDGQSADLGGVRQRLVVARLALSVGRAVPVADLVDLLWPDDVPASSVGNLQSYVSRVRRRMGRDSVVKEPGGYRLTVPRSSVDALRIEDELTGQADLMPSDRLEMLDGARRAWRGDSLADLTDWLDLVPEATRLDDLRISVIEQWAETALTVGRHDLCLSVLPEQARRHPTRENLHLALMEALTRSGRADEALRVGHELRRSMAETSGLEPTARVGRLEQQLLTQTDSRPVETIDPSVPRPPANAFVGRDAELEQLRTSTGEPGVVVVIGPAGAGKTRLILESLMACRPARPVRFVDLTAYPSPDQVLPGVAGQLGIGSAQVNSPRVVADALDRHTLLVLDNCEQVAETMTSLVESVVRARADLTVLCSSRHRLDIDGSETIALGPLPPDSARRLFDDRARRLRSGFDPGDVDTAHLEAVIAAADGLPLAIELFSARERIVGIEALARQLVDHQVAARVEDLVPELVASVEGSYQLVSAEAQRLFRALSLVPGDFPLGLVDVLSPQPVSDLTELIDSCLVTVDHGRGVRYRLLYPARAFGLHCLHRKENRAEWSGFETAIGEWVVAATGQARQHQNERLPSAGEFLRRDTPVLDTAIDWLIDADRHLDAALLAVDISLLVTDDPSTDWLRRLAALGELASSRGFNDSEATALFALSGACVAWIGGDMDQCQGLLHVVRDNLPSQHDLGWYIDFIATVAAVYGADPGVVERHARAVHANGSTPDFLRATALCAGALAHTYAGAQQAASVLVDLDRPLLDRVGEVDGFIDFTRAELCAASDPVRALDLLERSQKLCASAGHSYNRRVAMIARLGLLVRQGQRDMACELAPLVAEECQRAGMWPQAWIVARLSAELLAGEGRPTEAALLLNAADDDPASPSVSGEDAVRIDRLRTTIGNALDDNALARTRDRAAQPSRSELATFIRDALDAG